jgi:hypothetical protein
MTAKEKATKLVSMSELIILAETGHKLNVKERKAIAKHYAINCCDEVLGETSNKHFIIGRNGASGVEYWEKVKQELENL